MVERSLRKISLQGTVDQILPYIKSFLDVINNLQKMFDPEASKNVGKKIESQNLEEMECCRQVKNHLSEREHSPQNWSYDV